MKCFCSKKDKILQWIRYWCTKMVQRRIQFWSKFYVNWIVTFLFCFYPFS